jgi:hypothetical protein
MEIVGKCLKHANTAKSREKKIMVPVVKNWRGEMNECGHDMMMIPIRN